jgi:4'-phosphopantetheinyl transferase
MHAAGAEDVHVAWGRAASLDAAAQLVRAEVARVRGSAPAEVRVTRLCPRCGSTRHGRPSVADHLGHPSLHVSVSRTGSLAVVAVTTAGEVGVDVEEVAAPAFLEDRVGLHPAELATYPAGRAATWVRKEAVLKALGLGLTVDPAALRMSPPAHPPEVVRWPDAIRPVPKVVMHDIATESTHVAAVAVLAEAPVALSVRKAAPGELAP